MASFQIGDKVLIERKGERRGVLDTRLHVDLDPTRAFLKRAADDRRKKQYAEVPVQHSAFADLPRAA